MVYIGGQGFPTAVEAVFTAVKAGEVSIGLQVIGVGGETFTVQLRPLVGEAAAQQETEIFLEDVDLSDRFLIKPGAVFYWSIGYLDKPSGRIRASIFRFRRLPTWSKQQLQQARSRADRLKELLDVD